MLGHQVEVGGKCHILLTTLAGLCGYNISDVIEVAGVFYKNFVVGCINEGNRFSSIMGEKLSE